MVHLLDFPDSVKEELLSSNEGRLDWTIREAMRLAGS